MSLTYWRSVQIRIAITANHRKPLLIRRLATMSASTTADKAVLEDFHAHLQKSRRICALLGAGLSASSGLPTFRGAGGLWRTNDAMMLATPEAFDADPSLVWQFYSYRRHMALNAQPNPAHHALAQLATTNPQFLTLSQNVDGLSPRAGHPAAQLKLLHGSLYDIKCRNKKCDYIEKDNYTDPIVPALAIPQAEDGTQSNPLIRGLDISDEKHKISSIPTSELPQCPSCKKALLRPGVVWFGEALPRNVLDDVDAFFSSREPIDLMLVIGTSGTVYPAASFMQIAKQKGARVAVINPDSSSGSGLDNQKDWFFQEDAATALPAMLKPIIGDVELAKPNTSSL